MANNQIGTEKYTRIANEVNLLIRGVCAKHPELKMGERKGAYFCLSERAIPLTVGLAGDVEHDGKRVKYDEYSRTKCQLAFEGRELGYRTSLESPKRLQGGVCGNEYEHGCSGYTDPLDEVASTLCAFLCGDLDVEQAKKLLSNNSCFTHFEEFFATRMSIGI